MKSSNSVKINGAILFLSFFFHQNLSNNIAVSATQCFSSWIGLSTAINWAHLNPSSSRDFIICPNSAFDLEMEDPTLYPIRIGVDNIIVRCGEDSNDSYNLNECIVSGGWASFKITDLAKNVTIDGITFKSSSLSPILAMGEYDASAQIIRCMFQWNRGLATILVYNEKNDVVLTPKITMSEITNQPSIKQSMNLRISDCIFDENYLTSGAVMSLRGRVTVDASVFAANLATVGVVSALSGTFVAIRNSCFVANKVVQPGVIFIDSEAFITENSFNFGLGNHIENGSCDSLFLGIDGQCINDPDKKCVGICTDFTSEMCTTSIGIDVMNRIYPSNAPSKFLEQENVRGYFAFHFNARNIAILVVAGFGLIVVMCAGYISSYRLGQRSIMKKYRNVAGDDGEQTTELTTHGIEKIIIEEEAKTDPKLINNHIYVTENDSDEEDSGGSPNTMLACNGEDKASTVLVTTSVPAWLNQAGNDHDGTTITTYANKNNNVEQHHVALNRFAVSELPTINEIQNLVDSEDEERHNHDKGREGISNTTYNRRSSLCASRQETNPFQNGTDISWSMERTYTDKEEKIPTKQPEFENLNPRAIRRDSSFRGKNPFDFSCERISDLDEESKSMEGVFHSSSNAYSSFAMAHPDSSEDDDIEWSYDRSNIDW